MNLMFCIGGLSKGGAERVVCNLSNHLINDNDVSIVTTTVCKSEYALDEKINVFSLDDNSNIDNFIKRNVNRLKKLKRIINEIKPDVILSFLPEPSYRVLMLKPKAPVIVSVRNDPKVEYKNFVNRLIMKILYKRATGFVFQTNEAKEYFSKKIQDRSVVIANPVDDKFLDAKRSKAKDVIVTVGRLTPQKNHKLLIDSFSKVLKKYPNYELHIYGDGILKEELDEYIKISKLTKNVFLCGLTDDVVKALKNKKMFVLSSDYEGMPNALMEAMALGLPCISTDCPCGGPRELIKNNKNGILDPVNNCDALTKSITKLIKDEKMCKKIADNAKKDSIQFKNETISSKWYDFIKEVSKNV